MVVELPSTAEHNPPRSSTFHGPNEYTHKGLNNVINTEMKRSWKNSLCKHDSASSMR